MSCEHSNHRPELGLRNITGTAQRIMGEHGHEHDSATSMGYPKLNFEPQGQKIHNIYQDRLRQFTASGQYEGKNLLSMMVHDRDDDTANVELSVYSVPHLRRPSFEEVMKEAVFKPAKKGDSFGPSWSTHWFKVKLTIPQKLQIYDHLEFHWDANCEGLVYSEDGEPIQGLTGGGERVEYVLPKDWKDGKPHLFYIEISCNGMFGNAPGGDSIQPPKPDRYFDLCLAELVAPNLEAKALYIDFWIIGDAAREFPSDSWESHYALQVANDIMNTFEQGNQESILACRKIGEKYLGEKVNSADVYKSGTEPIVFATGHCHIDCCWLWPFAETKRKVARSWASQCELMDRYPEHRFTASSALQYQWLETVYPKLFARVKDNVRRGKFQYIGGSWVEHDTNMPSGESLSRQFLVGQRYFESRFGARCKTFWLPDTFGYSAQLPQLCRLAGMSRFLTQKLSWNNINKFPHTTFNWVALDGSQVLSHMPPSETYVSQAHFGDMKRSITQHKSLDDDHTSLLVFGHGDGGGGPTSEHIEKLRRCRGLSDKVGSLPRVHMGSSVDDWFSRIEKKVTDGVKLATWYGELYFELHRGTYTTQARNKKYNRKAEMLMREIETLATYASLATNYKYPNKEFEELWHIICQCQFHDCLPGSSIGMVYEESNALYAELFERGRVIMKEASEALGISLKSGNSQHELVGLNISPWERMEIVELPTIEGSSKSQYTVLNAPKGSGLMQPYPVNSITTMVSATETKPGVFVLMNDKIRVTIEGGHVASLVDLHLNRELIPEGKRANQLVIMDDKPLYWQAWDVEVYNMETRKEIPAGKVVITENGPYRAALQVESKISETSWIKTTISLHAAISGAGAYIQFDNEVEWRESMKFLKVEFPVDIYNTEASYETQYGIIRRPTHYNTTWDMAKFEVCCHKWADLSEHGYGVSILNDCKYGFATVGNLMRLSLLRAPKAPDANADMGCHRFRYAILPHKGGINADIVRIARDFNSHVQIGYVSKEKLESVSRLLASVTVEGDPSIILDAVKRGEDDEDVSTGQLPVRKGRSIILRLYESLGGRYSATIKTSLPVKAVYKTNLLEDDLEQTAFELDDSKTTAAKVTLRPFEVATYRLQL